MESRMAPSTFTIFLIVVFCVTFGIASKILVIFPMPAPSHYILGKKIVLTLSERGHNVTYISPFEEKDVKKTYREVVLTKETSNQENESNSRSSNLMSVTSPLDMFHLMLGMSTRESGKILGHPALQNLLKNPDEKFDVVIMSETLTHPLKAIAYHYKAPLITVSTIGPANWINNLVGNPGPSSYIADSLMSFEGSMNFYQRLINFAFSWYTYLYERQIYFPLQEEVTKKYFPGAPSVDELAHSVSLVFLNSHISTNRPVPLLPNMIEIGGYHVDPPKKLPEDLDSYLNNSKHGVIYFSLGSNLRSSTLPPELRDTLLNTFAKLKYDVLWKFEDDTLPGKPENVRISKWVPQQDVLAHSKVILFITHGGLLSTIETIYHGKPIIGLPVFGDQQRNMAGAVASGFALELDVHTLTEEKLLEALKEVLENPKYTENAKKRSMLMHDRIVSPNEALGYWVEYVIRHRGAGHFRSAALDLAWYQLYSVDVISSVLFVFGGVIYLLLRIFKRNSKKELPKKHKEE